MSERRPTKVFKSGLSIGLQIAAWENDKGVSYTIQKRFKDKDSGEYKETKSLYAADLAALALLAPAAIQYADDLYESRRAGDNAADAKRGAAPVKMPPLDTDDIPF